jgi:site-specific recombinase XerD
METVNIYAELQQPNKQGTCAIVIRFDIRNKHIGTQKIGHRVPSKAWDNDRKKVKENYPNAVLINGILENTINRHNNFILRRKVLQLPVNKEVILRYLKNKGAFESFHSYAAIMLEEKTLKDGKGYDEDTRRRYRDEIKRMQQYKAELYFHQITVKWLEDYKAWMQNVYVKKDGKKMHENSIWKALSFVRMVYNQAIRDEIIRPEENPFKKFNVGSYEENTENIKWLEKDQMERLEYIVHTGTMQDLTRAVGWRFLSMCVSGMRISDAMNLDDYFFNDAGDLVFKPHKTRRHGNTATIPITTERQRRYFKNTLDHHLPATSAKSFRTTFNIHLKILAAMAGININLTSHCGRHTMGGFIVDAGIETKPAMAMLGVKSDDVIKTYMHLKKDKLRREADKLGNVF